MKTSCPADYPGINAIIPLESLQCRSALMFFILSNYPPNYVFIGLAALLLFELRYPVSLLLTFGEVVPYWLKQLVNTG